MTPLDVLWLFFLLSALQPLAAQKILEHLRRRRIGTLEGERGSRVILLVHRQETMSFLGFPLFRYIDVNDSEEVLRAIQLTDPEVPIDRAVTHVEPGDPPVVQVRALTDDQRRIF